MDNVTIAFWVCAAVYVGYNLFWMVLSDEYKKRLDNAMCMITLAWTAIRYDSRSFAIVMINSFRESRDDIITKVEFKDGITYNQYGARIKDVSNEKVSSD